MRERQLVQVTVSKQYREHAFCKNHRRLQTVVESKFASTQGRGLFPHAHQLSEYNGKEASASRVTIHLHILSIDGVLDSNLYLECVLSTSNTIRFLPFSVIKCCNFNVKYCKKYRNKIRHSKMYNLNAHPCKFLPTPWAGQYQTQKLHQNKFECSPCWILECILL